MKSAARTVSGKGGLGSLVIVTLCLAQGSCRETESQAKTTPPSSPEVNARLYEKSTDSRASQEPLQQPKAERDPRELQNEFESRAEKLSYEGRYSEAIETLDSVKNLTASRFWQIRRKMDSYRALEELGPVDEFDAKVYRVILERKCVVLGRVGVQRPLLHRHERYAKDFPRFDQRTVNDLLYALKRVSYSADLLPKSVTQDSACSWMEAPPNAPTPSSDSEARDLVTFSRVVYDEQRRTALLAVSRDFSKGGRLNELVLLQRARKTWKVAHRTNLTRWRRPGMLNDVRGPRE